MNYRAQRWNSFQQHTSCQSKDTNAARILPGLTIDRKQTPDIIPTDWTRITADQIHENLCCNLCCAATHSSTFQHIWTQPNTLFDTARAVSALLRGVSKVFLNRRPQVQVLPGAVSNQGETGSDTGCQEAHEDAVTKEVTVANIEPLGDPHNASSVPGDDSSMPADIPRSDKLSNKPDNKLIPLDEGLQVVMRLWHRLPPRIRSGILALAKSFCRPDDLQPKRRSAMDILNGIDHSEE